MDEMGMSGFVVGSIGLCFAIIAWGLIGNLRKDFEALKKNLKDAGVLQGELRSRDK